MAGDWMKVEKCTPEKPEIWSMADLLGIDPDAVFGKCFRIWSWFDDHTTDGYAPSVTPALLDRKTGVTGFGEAMASVGWLLVDEGELVLPNFDRHCGKTAKNRALSARRMQKQRYASSVTSAQPEKRREEKSNKESKPKKVKAFVRPTVGEVSLYCQDRKNNVNAQAFVDHYTANGWKVGKNSMVDWQAAVRQWERNKFDNGKAEKTHEQIKSERAKRIAATRAMLADAPRPQLKKA